MGSIGLTDGTGLSGKEIPACLLPLNHERRQMLETQKEPSLYSDYVGTLMADLQLPELGINIFLLGKPHSF